MQYLILLLFTALSCVAQAQTKPSAMELYAEPENSGIRRLLESVPQVKAPLQTNSGSFIRQYLTLDERDMKIVYYTAPYTANDDNKPPHTINWTVQKRMPLYLIDALIENREQKTLRFVMKNRTAFIAVYNKTPQGYEPVVYQEEITIPARILEVRNLTKRLHWSIKALQKREPRKIYDNARGVVSNAVSSYLAAKAYHPQQIQLLRNNHKLFVPKCRICDGAKNGFENYIKQVVQQKDVYIFPLSADLLSNNHDTQMAALEKLIGTAIKSYYEDYGSFIKTDIQKMEELIANERKRSMTIANGKKCAVCDGAAFE